MESTALHLTAGRHARGSFELTQFLARPAVWALFPRSTYQLARSGRHPPAGVPVGGVRLDGLSCPSHAPAPRRPEPRACHSKDEFKLRSQSPIRSFQSAVRRTTGPCGRAAEEEQTEGWDNEELVGLAGRHGPSAVGLFVFFFSSAVAGQGGEPARPVRGRNPPSCRCRNSRISGRLRLAIQC